MRGASAPAHKNMQSTVMLILTKHDEVLPGQMMERISDGDFYRGNQGIMSPFPTAAESEQP